MPAGMCMCVFLSISYELFPLLLNILLFYFIVLIFMSVSLGPLYNSTCIFFFSFSVFPPPFLSPLFFALAARGIFYGVSSFPVFPCWVFHSTGHFSWLPHPYASAGVFFNHDYHIFLLQKKKPPLECALERRAAAGRPLGGRVLVDGVCYFIYFSKNFQGCFSSQ